MSNPTSQSHGRGAQKLPSPPNASTPLSPTGGSGNPVSFHTNVNRAKTKRWIEAKQYSYDGTDWGDEDDEEYEEEPPPVPPPPPYASQRPGSGSDLSSRRLSGLAPGAEESRGSPSADARRADPSGGADPKAAAFIRPADIYKRMREERAPPRDAVDSGRRHENPQSSTQSGSIPAQADVTGGADQQSENNRAPLKTAGGTPSIGLPELKRISGFGTDFLGGADSNVQKTPSHESQDPSLQHNPSQGFRSVVHQAFDVPETPISTTGSVERSNSDGTSVISPIMGGRGLGGDKTPTILEEPGESNSSSGAISKETANNGPAFKPGHRRDISLPSGDNSPSKKPVVMDYQTPTADHAEMSSNSPPPLQSLSQAESAERPLDAGASSNRASVQLPSIAAEADLPAPLNPGSNAETGASDSHPYHGEIPIIVPSMSADNSPQETHNDRLSKEIMSSLSRENSPSEGQEEESQQPQSQAPNEGSIPHQYEKYWDRPTSPNVDEAPKPLVSEAHSEWTSPHPLAPKDPYANTTTGGASSAAVEQPKKPKLTRRFSWESSSSDEPEPPVPGSYSSPPPLGALATKELETLPQEATSPVPDTMPNEPLTPDPEAETPRLSIVPPVPEGRSSPEQVVEAPLPAASIDEKSLLGFREILGIKSSDERIRAFDRTRNQFATLDTGLNHWLEFTVHEHPDQAELVRQSQGLSSDAPRAYPTKSRFPKLTSLGNLASSLNDGSPTSTSHARRPSGPGSKPNVEHRGKDLLAFSGKAGEAAKGLFAKGRSKFRPSGGTDKGQSATAPRKSLQFSFPSSSDGSHGSSRLRNSVTFGSLPVFTSSRNEASTSGLGPDANVPASSTLESSHDGQANAGNRFDSAPSEDLSQSPGIVGGSVPARTAEKQLPLPPNAARRASEGFFGKYDFASDLKQEMLDALGLPPSDPRSQQPANTSLALNGADDQEKPSAQGPPQQTGEGRITSDPARETPKTEKHLPAIPDESIDVPVSSDTVGSQEQRGENVPETITAPMSTAFEEIKPSLPPKDHAPLPHENHAPHQPSVSTLGAGEQSLNRPPQHAGFPDDSASSLQPRAKETGDAVYGTPLLQTDISDISLPSVEGDTSGYGPTYPPGPPSSAQILETKRRSISGILQSIPGVQSPLRNEVRYSPGTRSSMLSFSSFGRHSANSKETHLPTPANDLSHHTESGPSAQDDESAMDKLKNFGKRRRASVGDILSGLQGERKRAFSRISGLFGRQQNSQHPESNTPSAARHGQPGVDPSSVDKPLPSQPALASVAAPPQAPNEAIPLPGNPRQRASMPLPPIMSFNSPSSGRFYSQAQGGAADGPPTTSRHTRAESQPLPGQSWPPLPPLTFDNGAALLPRLQEQEEQLHEEQRSGEQVLQQKPTQQAEQEGQGEQGDQAPQEQQAQKPQREQEQQKDQMHPAQQLQEQRESQQKKPLPQLPHDSTSNTPSRKAMGFPPASTDSASHAAEDVPLSSDSRFSSDHPHRSQARVLNDPPQPVELAITHDDSSEEIAMSATSYPGQEWMPMHI